MWQNTLFASIETTASTSRELFKLQSKSQRELAIAHLDPTNKRQVEIFAQARECYLAAHYITVVRYYIAHGSLGQKVSVQYPSESLIDEFIEDFRNASLLLAQAIAVLTNGIGPLPNNFQSFFRRFLGWAASTTSWHQVHVFAGDPAYGPWSELNSTTTFHGPYTHRGPESSYDSAVHGYFQFLPSVASKYALRPRKWIGHPEGTSKRSGTENREPPPAYRARDADLAPHYSSGKGKYRR
ncbi:hypothetical protein B0T21DRAFT_366708 [Apiosordaria backusii]|uniref:Uncharacterized protein n=1 Tax=Apiosordaria backusii TaxID=314023 RepID=A0AA40BL95_9PEZI|nr:hypothetical protein B0T21DRAFT_366708 [Apiosordaria backusii]